MKISIEFHHLRETKGTHVYVEVSPIDLDGTHGPSADPVVGTLYVRKAALRAEGNARPQVLHVTIQDEST